MQGALGISEAGWLTNNRNEFHAFARGTTAFPREADKDKERLTKVDSTRELL